MPRPSVQDHFVPGEGSTYRPGALEFAEADFDRNWVRLRRPYFDKHGRPSVTINTFRPSGGKRFTKQDSRGGEKKGLLEHVLIRDLPHGMSSPVLNATTLRKEEWILMDNRVVEPARHPMQAYADLAADNTYGGFDGMASTILEHETMSDSGEAYVDMNGLTEGTTDNPLFQLEGTPLAIVHSDFRFDLRTLRISRKSDRPLDVVQGANAGRRVGEKIEKLTIGVDTGIVYGGNSTQVGGYGRTSAVYGYLNFPARVTSTALTIPTGSNPEAMLSDVLTLIETMASQKSFGPFVLYVSTDYAKYLNNDYARAVVGAVSVATTSTLRQRLLAIEEIKDVRVLRFLRPTATTDAADIPASHAFTMILVQLDGTGTTARAVNGMGITTMQWEEKGGLELCFKVMTIQLPQLFADYSGSCGIMHARTA